MPAGWPILPAWSRGRCDIPQPAARLCRRHGGLLGLHAVGRRAADAGAAAFQQSGLHARAAGLAVPAVRGGRHRHQPGRRLAGRPLRPGRHALRRAWSAGCGPGGPGRAGSGLEHSGLCHLRHGGAGPVGGRQGPGENVLEIRRQAAGPHDRRRSVPLGRAADRIEKRGEGAWLLSGRGPAGAGRVPDGGLGHGRRADGHPCRRCPVPAARPARTDEGGRGLGRLAIKGCPRQPAQPGADVPVRRARRVVRCRRAGLFSDGAVGRHR